MQLEQVDSSPEVCMVMQEGSWLCDSSPEVCVGHEEPLGATVEAMRGYGVG